MARPGRAMHDPPPRNAQRYDELVGHAAAIGAHGVWIHRVETADASGAVAQAGAAGRVLREFDA